MNREVRRASKLLGLEVRRRVPGQIRVVDLPGGRCVHRENDVLLVSSGLVGYMSYVLAKEAVVTLMVPEMDEVPQVHDLAWVYSSAPRDLWERCRVPPEGPFHDYDPYELLSLVPSKDRHRVLGTLIRILNASAMKGSLEFPMYSALLHRIVGSSVGFSESDKKLVRIISENPRATSDYMKRRGMGGSSLTRSMRKLRTLGMIAGPENVDLSKLGLATVLVTFPNVKECRKAFWRFPYTYSMLVPVSRDVSVHAYLSYPFRGMEKLLSLKDLGLKVFLVKKTFMMLNLDPAEDPFEAVSLSLSQERRDPPEDDVPSVAASIRVDRVDLTILNYVMAEGRVSASMLAKRGIKRARERLRELRRAGIIMNLYTVGLPKGVEKAVIRVEAGVEEMGPLTRVLGSGGSVIVQHLEGDSSHLIGVLMAPPKIKGDLFRILRTLYGDRLLVAEDFVDIEPGWRLPVDLWDERSQTFLWREPLDGLMKDLSGCLP